MPKKQSHPKSTAYPKQRSVAFDTDTDEKIAQIAKEWGCSESAVIRRCVKLHLFPIER